MDVQLGRICFIRGDNDGKYPFNHSVYLEGRNCRVVIDPSCSLQKLTDLKQKDGVDQVWLSHWHEDHMGFLNLFDHCALRISKSDFPPLTDIEIFLDWYGIKEVQLRELWKNIMLNNFNYRPQQEALFLQDEEVIDLGVAFCSGDCHAGTHTGTSVLFLSRRRNSFSRRLRFDLIRSLVWRCLFQH